jgi:hypothetical protein
LHNLKVMMWAAFIFAASQNWATATVGLTAFPPENCTQGLTMYMGWDGVHSTSCNTGQDILKQTLGCSEGQLVVFEGGKYACKALAAPSACGANELLTFDGTKYSCVHNDMPTCSSNQVLTFNGSGFVCVNRTDSIPTCGTDQFLTYNGASFQCANTQRIAIPSCGESEVLTADAGTLTCVGLPKIEKNLLFTQELGYAIENGDTPAEYNELMAAAVRSWPPLAGNGPDQASNIAACSVDPSTGRWVNAGSSATTCGLMLCHQVTGFFSTISQLHGTCGVGDVNCGGYGRNGFAIAWGCLYSKN